MDKSDLILAAIERVHTDILLIKADVAELKSYMAELKRDRAASSRSDVTSTG
jgi:hypothetical protein